MLLFLTLEPKHLILCLAQRIPLSLEQVGDLLHAPLGFPGIGVENLLLLTKPLPPLLPLPKTKPSRLPPKKLLQWLQSSPTLQRTSQRSSPKLNS